MLGGCDEHIVISIENYEFHPDKLVVPSGTEVKWINRDNCVHNVATTDGSFISADLEYGETFVKMMNSPRRFRYYCSMYPHMMGEIRVQQRDQSKRKAHEANSHPSKVQALKNGPGIKKQKKPGASFTVRIREWKHLPARVQINVGDTVVWVTDFDDSTPYVLQCHAPEFQSAKLSNGASFAFQFDDAGTFSVFDALYPRMSATEVRVCPQSTARGLDDLEQYLKQWQTQADVERQNQLQKSMGTVKSRAAKFSAYLSSPANPLHQARNPLGSFAPLTSGLKDVSGSALNAKSEKNEVSIRPASTKKKRPSKKMRKKLQKLRNLSSGGSKKAHNDATTQPATVKAPVTPNKNLTAETNETVNEPQTLPESNTQIKKKNTKSRKIVSRDSTVLRSVKERPFNTARRAPTRSTRPASSPAPKNVVSTKVNVSKSRKSRPVREPVALTVPNSSKDRQATAVNQIVQTRAKARTPKRHRTVAQRGESDLSPDQNKDSTNCVRPVEPVATNRVSPDRNFGRHETPKSTNLHKPNNSTRRTKANKFDVLAALNFLNSRYFEAMRLSHSNRQ